LLAEISNESVKLEKLKRLGKDIAEALLNLDLQNASTWSWKYWGHSQKIRL